jgi:hypothetical protein
MKRVGFFDEDLLGVSHQVSLFNNDGNLWEFTNMVLIKTT